MSRGTSPTRGAVAWFVASTLLLVGPAFEVLGNRVHPRVLGLPWSLCYVLLVLAANFAVLAILYRLRLIDHAELDEPEDPPACEGNPRTSAQRGGAGRGATTVDG